MYKQYLALNNIQCLIYHKIEPDQTKPTLLGNVDINEIKRIFMITS